MVLRFVIRVPKSAISINDAKLKPTAINNKQQQTTKKHESKNVREEGERFKTKFIGSENTAEQNTLSCCFAQWPKLATK